MAEIKLTAAQQAANWREMANAMGLNSGAFGQAALAQSNALQGNLNTLNTAQATAQADIERQRALLGQQYQLAILEAQANNDFELAQALYQEAVRQDEALRQQEQFNAQMNLQYMQMIMNNSGGLRSSGSNTVVAPSSNPQPVSDDGAGNNVDDVDLFYQLRSAGSQIAGATDNAKKAELENSVINTIGQMIATGQLTEQQGKAWLDAYGI